MTGENRTPAQRTSGVWGAVRPRLDLAAIALGLAAMLLLPSGGVPTGITAAGIVAGSGLALQAIGVILVLRSNRIINFAQVPLGLISAVLFRELALHYEWVLLFHAGCGGCLPGLPNDPAFLQSHPNTFLRYLLTHGDQAAIVANFWISAVLAVLVAPLVSWLAYMLVIRRFDRASRLTLTIVTIALANILFGIAGGIPAQVFQDPPNLQSTLVIPVRDVRWHLDPITLHTPDLAIVAAALLSLLGLVAYFRFGRGGVAIRGAAENPSRALTLGIGVAGLASRSWVLAGLLSGVAGVLGVMTTGQDPSSLSAEILVMMLAAVVVARLRSLVITFAMTVALGIAQHVFVYVFRTGVAFEATLLAVTVGTLLLQVSTQSRAEQEAAVGHLAAREARPMPRELRYLPVVDGWLRWFWVALVVVAVGLPFALAPDQVSFATVIVITAIIGLSLLVLTGWAGQISLGQSALAAVGGFAASALAVKFGLFILPALLAGGLAGSAVAVVLGIPSLRLRGLYLAVTTLAFGLFTTNVILNPDYLGQYLPALLERPVFFGFSLDDDRAFYYLSLFFLVLAAALVVLLRQSRAARALIACRDNEQAAQSFGINLLRARLMAFAVSGFLAAFAGGLLAYQQHGVQAAAFSPDQSLGVFLIVVIGGFGSVAGPLLGAAYNGLLVLAPYAIVQPLGSGAGVLAVLLLMPGGLTELVYKARDTWLRRVAIRYRIPVPSLLADSEVLEGQAAIAPKLRPGGGTVFVPVVYEVPDQWITEREAMHG